MDDPDDPHFVLKLAEYQKISAMNGDSHAKADLGSLWKADVLQETVFGLK